MLNNSLLSAYKKRAELRKKFWESKAKDRLLKRKCFYAEEGNVAEFNKAHQALMDFDSIEMDFKNAFIKKGLDIYEFNNYCWEEFYHYADQLMYGQPKKEEYPFKTNEILMKKMVEELNKKFPEEHWEYGEIPLYSWQQLDYPGREVSDVDIYRWKKAGACYDGGWFLSSAKMMKCIYQADAKKRLVEAQDDVEKLGKVSESVYNNRQVYVVERDELMDNECAGGAYLYIPITFEEGASNTFYDTPFTPQEKVINDFVVSEIDEKCATMTNINKINEQLDRVDRDLNDFILKHNLQSSPIM